MKEDKKLNMLESIILLLLIIGSVAVCIRLKTGGPMIGLFFSWIIIYLFCLVLRIDYKKILDGAYEAIRVVVPTLVLLMAIGVMIGTWLQSGTIATIIVGGLQMINPTWLLPLTLIFCAVLSLVTGTSYGSVGSAGVAMMAIGNAMGINAGMVAGAVICGAMFGDKLSPLSDTTNLAPAVAGAKLSDHVKSMLWTTLPAFIVSLILFTILGFRQTSGGYVAGDLSAYIQALNGEFHLGFVTLLPAILLIALLLLKVNAVAALGLSSLAAGLVSFFYQGIDLASIIKVAYNGYTTGIDVGILQTILNRGGMSSMLQYVAIISFAVGMGGMLDRLGVLENILRVLVKGIKNDGTLITITLVVGYVTSIISCSQPMAHVLTGRLMKPIFEERKIAPEILSRSLEDSGTLAGPMIPWHGYCVYMSGTLGVAWAAFFPYLFLLYLTPIFSIFYGFTGISIKHIDEPEEVSAEANA
ncbi:MAG: Na+/H+ antiporter NhaC [Oscillospiraceae bacterium]|nr:Na+/H+ antiporter NhaC [Oscillospiraceae bacterium]